MQIAYIDEAFPYLEKAYLELEPNEDRNTLLSLAEIYIIARDVMKKKRKK